MKIEDPLPDFFTTLCTPSKEFENDCASMEQIQILVIMSKKLSVSIRQFDCIQDNTPKGDNQT
jgi:hypothetical protein